MVVRPNGTAPAATRRATTVASAVGGRSAAQHGRTRARHLAGLVEEVLDRDAHAVQRRGLACGPAPIHRAGRGENPVGIEARKDLRGLVVADVEDAVYACPSEIDRAKLEPSPILIEERRRSGEAVLRHGTAHDGVGSLQSCEGSSASASGPVGGIEPEGLTGARRDLLVCKRNTLPKRLDAWRARIRGDTHERHRGSQIRRPDRGDPA